MQPILADEVQTFKALITVHKVLQEGHPVVSNATQAFISASTDRSNSPLKRHMGRPDGLRRVRERWDMKALEVRLATSS